jgi:hypothetical protein
MGGHRLPDKSRILDMQLWARRPVGEMMTEPVVHVEPADTSSPVDGEPEEP